MKILNAIASTDPRSGGPWKMICDISRAQTAEGHVAEVICLDAPDAPWLNEAPLTVHSVGPALMRNKYAVGYTKWLEAHIAEYDIIFVHGLWDYAALGVWKVLGKKDSNYIIYTHGMLDPWFRRFRIKTIAKDFYFRLILRRILGDAKAVIFTADDELQLASQSYRLDFPNRVVIPLGVESVPPRNVSQDVAFDASTPNLGKRPFLLFLGRVHEKKGVDLLLEAYCANTQLCDECDLVVAGPDQANLVAELSAIAGRHGLANRVHFPGMLHGDAKWGALNRAEAFILPSHQENFGIAIVEAMSAARPVFITDKVNIWREIEVSGGGVVDADTSDGVSRLLARLARMSPAERLHMGQMARAGYEQHFTINRMMDALRPLMTTPAAKR